MSARDSKDRKRTLVKLTTMVKPSPDLVRMSPCLPLASLAHPTQSIPSPLPIHPKLCARLLGSN